MLHLVNQCPFLEHGLLACAKTSARGFGLFGMSINQTLGVFKKLPYFLTKTETMLLTNS